MPTRLATGLSSGEDTRQVALSALEEAKGKLQGAAPDLITLYCASKYDYQAAVDAVREATERLPLISSESRLASF